MIEAPPDTSTDDSDAERACIKVRRIAAELDCSERHVYDLIAKGELDSVRIGSGRLGLRVKAGSYADYKRRIGL